MEATITSIIVLVTITLGYLFFPSGEVVLDFVRSSGLVGLEPNSLLFRQNSNLLVPELILLSFVGFSVPCWGAYVVALDTSNRRARAKAEKALEERALLAARIQQDQQSESLVRVSGEVAHDFNNTLMVISGSLDILEHHEDFPKELIHNLQMMRNATKISAGLTNKLLNFCQGKTTPLVQINPIHTIQELFPLLEFTIRSKGRFNLFLPKASSRTLEISSGKLEQVILNLITNARDAIDPDGEISLHVQYSILKDDQLVEANDQQATYICVSVVDNGIGMSKEVQERVFEPFYSNKPSPHRGGLGLAIVHGIVVQSNGILRIQSQEGEGTTIKIALPLDKETPTLDVEPRQGGGTKILLVDDEPNVLYAVARQLELLGYSVREAGTVDEALELISKEQFLLMITDVRLNGDSGFDLAKVIRNRKYTIPILFITGFSGFSENKRKNKVILLKPFNGLQLQNKINEVLERD